MLVQSAFPHHAVLPGLCTDVVCFHVSLADILVAQLWPAFGSPSRCQLFIKKCLLGCGHPPCGRHDPANTILGCLSRMNMLGRLARDRTSALDTLSCQDMPRIRRILLGWKELSRFSCLAYVVHVSLLYVSVLTTQTLYTTILVFTVNLGLVHTREVRQASVVAAFPILLSISVSKESCSTTSTHSHR